MTTLAQMWRKKVLSLPTKSAKPKPTAVYLDPAHVRAIKLLATVEDKTISDFLGEVFDHYISIKYGAEFVDRLLEIGVNISEALKLLTEMQLKSGKAPDETVAALFDRVIKGVDKTTNEAEE